MVRIDFTDHEIEMLITAASAAVKSWSPLGVEPDPDFEALAKEQHASWSKLLAKLEEGTQVSCNCFAEVKLSRNGAATCSKCGVLMSAT